MVQSNEGNLVPNNHGQGVVAQANAQMSQLSIQ